MFLTFLGFFGHKFSKIHIFRSKMIRKQLILFFIVEQLMYLSLSKLICELIYERWTPIYSYSFYYGLVIPSLLQYTKITSVKNLKLSFLCRLIENKHNYLVLLFVCLLALVPNFPFIMIEEIYIKKWIATLLNIYGAYLTIVVLYSFFHLHSF